MAFLKLNRFHWHMIDDESFRLELTSFPELADKTGMRGNGCVQFPECLAEGWDLQAEHTPRMM